MRFSLRSRLNKSRDIDMLHGPLLGKVFRFALPLMLTNLLQMLYNAADMVIAGMSGVEGAIGSIGTTNAMINLFLNLFMGFSVGTAVCVAHDYGAKYYEGVHRDIHTSILISLMEDAPKVRNGVVPKCLFQQVLEVVLSFVVDGVEQVLQIVERDAADNVVVLRLCKQTRCKDCQAER